MKEPENFKTGPIKACKRIIIKPDKIKTAIKNAKIGRYLLSDLFESMKDISTENNKPKTEGSMKPRFSYRVDYAKSFL